MPCFIERPRSREFATAAKRLERFRGAWRVRDRASSRLSLQGAIMSVGRDRGEADEVQPPITEGSPDHPAEQREVGKGLQPSTSAWPSPTEEHSLTEKGPRPTSDALELDGTLALEPTHPTATPALAGAGGDRTGLAPTGPWPEDLDSAARHPIDGDGHEKDETHRATSAPPNLPGEHTIVMTNPTAATGPSLPPTTKATPWTVPHPHVGPSPNEAAATSIGPFQSNWDLGVSDNPGVGPTEAESSTANRSREIEAGSVLFDKYRVIKKLGQGGMGTVWLVTHMQLKTPRALKTLIAGVADSPEAIERFRREGQVMATFSTHPHAVAVHDANLNRDQAYIEMEYVEGQTLDQLLKLKQPLSPQLIGRVLDQLCEVLRMAHKRGIVHRDLKPANLMLLSDREPGREHLKVLDFGIARMLDHTEMATLTHGFLGTPAYASPEQCLYANAEQAPEGAGPGSEPEPPPPLDHRSDLYSTGVILCEMLTGRRVFTGPVVKIIHDKVYGESPRLRQLNPDLPEMPELELVVARCLEKDPAKRPQSAEQLANEFKQAMEHDLGVTTQVERKPWAEPTDPLRDSRWDGPMARSSPFATTEADRSLLQGGIAGLDAEQRRKQRLRRILVASSLVGLVGMAGILVLAVPALRGSLNPAVATSSGGNAGGTGSVGGTTGPRPIPLKAPEGFELEKGSQGVAGWARVVLGPNSTRYRLITSGDQANGRYLPEGYEPVPGEGEVGGWPRIVERAGTGARFIRIAGGEFMQGAIDPNAPDAFGRGEDRPPHKVRLSDYYLQQTEVTNGEINAFFQLNPPGPNVTESYEKWKSLYAEAARVDKPKSDQMPAAGISRRLALLYARSVSCRLPTESEWEYAARSGGKLLKFVWGNAEAPSRDLVNINDATRFFSPVKSWPKDRTEQEIHDLAGNAREWCQDIYEAYAAADQALINPGGPKSTGSESEEFVVRGASYLSAPEEVGTTRRADHYSQDRVEVDLGFRLVLVCPPEPPAAVEAGQ